MCNLKFFNLKPANIIFQFLFLTVFFFSSVLYAEICPLDTMPAEGDFDGDGILNKDDKCCYVTSLYDDNSGQVCSAEDKDRNGNGQLGSIEQMCCVNTAVDVTDAGIPAHTYCGKAVVDLSQGSGWKCENGMALVPCDNFLLYDGMKPAVNPGSTTGDQDAVTCTAETCICYTIGDYDGDDIITTGEPANFYHNGPFDNCPTTENSGTLATGQPDKDHDLYGNECDSCIDTPDTIFAYPEKMTVDYLASKLDGIQCDVVTQEGCPNSYCAPRAIYNPIPSAGVNDSEVLEVPEFAFNILVLNMCAEPVDKDRDGVANSCDNCIAVPNYDQLDLNKNGIGDVCEETDSDTWIDTATESDSTDSECSDTDTNCEDSEFDSNDTDLFDTSSDYKDTDKKDTDKIDKDTSIDTGAVSFSGGGIISCSVNAAGKSQNSNSLIHLLIETLF
ncbi:MAG: hypothetical protein JXR91_14805 [Deltaproteobacteria bacterium]|nr:hypothetical protein [Deltaproteobacteria bacterium]